MNEVEYYRRSPHWRRSIGLKPFARHYRQRDGTGHAVCRRDGRCEVHFDAVNPHRQPFKHLRHDAPGVLLLAAIAGIGYLVSR